MARRPKTTEETWFDIFSDADLADQVRMLEMLQEIHRQARRGKLKKAESGDTLPLMEAQA